jgi:hypothetical protein
MTNNAHSQDQYERESNAELASRILDKNPSLAKWILIFFGIFLLIFILPYALGHTAFLLRECKNLKTAVKDLKIN